jgi:hypothetical protein
MAVMLAYVAFQQIPAFWAIECGTGRRFYPINNFQAFCSKLSLVIANLSIYFKSLPIFCF